MVPLKLFIKNFLSYGAETQVLDFEPHHMICLSGKNGHGKSALLDALTWVLWGQARKVAGTSKADDGLIRLHQNHMMVSLDFICKGITYRVRREYTLHQNKALSHLDFGSVNPETNQLQSLSDKTIRGTQEKINAALGLDYDVFINAAFLRQGQANEFSKKSARERKEILASILGLDRYELIRRKALDALKHAQQEKESCMGLHATTVQEVGSKTTVIEQLNTLQVQLQELANQEGCIVSEHQALEAALQEIAQQKNTLQTQQALYNQAERARKEYAATLLERIATWRMVHRQHHRIHEHAHAYKVYAEIEQKLQALQPQLITLRTQQAKLAQLKEQLNHSKEHIVVRHAQQQQTLTTEQAKLQSALSYYDVQAQELQKNATLATHELANLRISMAQAAEQAVRLDAIVHNHASVEAQFERRKQAYHRWLEQGKALKEQCAELEEKQQKIMNATCSECPLCLQNLSTQTRTLVLASFEVRQKTIMRALQRLSSVLPRLKKLLVEQHAVLKTYAQAQQEREIIRNRLVDLQNNDLKKTAQINDLNHQLEKIGSERVQTQTMLEHAKQTITALGSLEQSLNQDLQYQALTKQVEQQHATLAGLETVEHEYQTYMKNLNELDAQRKQYEKIMHDCALQQERAQEIQKISHSIRRVKQESKALKHALQALPEIETKAADLHSKKQQCEHARSTLVSKKEAIAHQRGALEHQKNVLEKKELELQKFQERISVLDQAINDYQAINQALGKDGIQALLIEEALPDIELEANAILSKLTDNQAHIIIESLRDLKSGSTKETLDIKISDSLGIRPYEMFSGGEAFRIDFALRIAISKLLARRAGANMQLLIIDEGFGSQDEEGLAHIMDMLHKIQDSFAKIVIVSHLPALKEQFPVHVVIQKTPQGSMINVVQNG